MQDERNIPQDEDAEEVEAHLKRPGRSADEEDDDEVEAHWKSHGAPEEHSPDPSQ